MAEESMILNNLLIFVNNMAFKNIQLPGIFHNKMEWQNERIKLS